MSAASKFNLSNLEDSIILLTVNEGEDIELDDAIEMRKQMNVLSENKMYCVLLDAHSHFHVSHEARAIIAGKEYSAERIASAFIIKSIALRIVANFFILVNRPQSPTKIFTEQESALTWLREEIEGFKKQKSPEFLQNFSNSNS